MKTGFKNSACGQLPDAVAIQTLKPEVQPERLARAGGLFSASAALPAIA
jgi:hypothetical protein